MNLLIIIAFNLKFRWYPMRYCTVRNVALNDKIRLIRDRLKTASDRQKSYANIKGRDIKFEVGDHGFLKVSPRKKVLRFSRKGKLSL